MRQKNYRWLLYVVTLGIAAIVLYVAFQDITPPTRHVEQNAEITFEK